MVTSYFRLEVKIWPFRACTMKNMQYNPYLFPNYRNLCILKEIGVEEHDDIRFKTGSGNMAISCTAYTMKNMQYNHYYGNSSFIVPMDLVMGQIPCFTERICSFAHAAVINFPGFCIAVSATVIALFEHL